MHVIKKSLKKDMQKRFMTQKALFIGKNFLEKSVFSLEKP